MNQSTLRLTRELADIQKSNDLSIAVACRDSDIRNIRALILGPPETPYEFGFFEFTMKFPKEYPGKAPAVNAITTNGGRCRFNPNIYAGGKVCLSILGTWRGERGEEWSSAQGLESILISIQSLMSSNPYENEPGYENANSQHDKDNQKAYVLKIRHETLRIAIIQRLEEYLGLKADGTSIVREPRDEAGGDSSSAYVDEGGVYFFEPFKDLCKRRFLWYYDTYLASIQAEKEKVTEGQAFVQMPFEMSGGSGGNSMEGKFNYPELERRIQNIRQKLDAEAEGWGVEGMKAFKDERGVAANLQRQFEQAKVFFDKSETATLDMELEDNNPFIWRVTYFGRPMTNLDGGLFIFTVRFSVRFPDEQPRVQFSTPMFHHKINKDGIPAYFPGGLHPRPDDAKSHIEGVISLLEEEDPAYDPRTQINIDASKLYWGTKEEKREYSKQFRRSVQRSIEYA
ncbi:hypothetical protein TWF706_000981 [Orbilia oligospora]|uniref:Ubiquitin-conjugating enzyme E2 Z n=2 Tax=Orbilia oligospora TaxID=2813651 RepID=A0A7C8NYI2_ORBOL|nr:hypothetical protein TWF706_000981 [Orbilia oligospora]KAF3120029.1 hypothetical protein TWF703_002932 [Orbilia oligospora]